MSSEGVSKMEIEGATPKPVADNASAGAAKTVDSVASSGGQGAEKDPSGSETQLAAFVNLNLKATKKANVTDEAEIIKRRLVIDGDGQGDDKKLTKLMQSYLIFFDDLNKPMGDSDPESKLLEDYETFKAIHRQTESLRVSVTKTCKAITANCVAAQDLESVRKAIAKEVAEMKITVKEIRERAAEVKRNRQRLNETEALLKLLRGLRERREAEAERNKLSEEYNDLLRAQAVLDKDLKVKKIYLGHLYDLMKKITSSESKSEEDSFDSESASLGVAERKEEKERALSDVSMDLD